MAQVVPKRMTVEEFEQECLGKPVELICGEVRERMPAGERHGRVAGRTGVRAGYHALIQRLGESYIAEVGFVLKTSRGESVRAPDFAFIRKERLPEVSSEQFSRVVPDLVLEVRSPRDTDASLREKVAEWLEAGVQMVWVADPEQRTIEVHRPDGTVQTLKEDDLLIGDPVLPGFQMLVQEAFE